MARDHSMYGWTPESIDEKAQKDAEDGVYRPIPGWIGPLSVHTEAGSRYDKAYRYHRDNDD
jgi:hypothetical protein